jgi:tripartite-type tricarboxylate transporter receptor subunit TctC
MKRTHFLKLTACALALSALSAASLAQDAWPSKPITLIVPYPAGTGPDILARPLAERLSAALGQPVLVDNRPGASAVIGTQAVAKANADGYTLLYGISGPIALNPLGLKKLPYDPKKDLTVVVQLQQRPLVFLSSSALPGKTLKEFVAHTKANPRTLAFATWGAASSGHVAGEYLNKQAGIDLLHVPYKEAYLNDLAAGRVAAAFSDPGSSRPFIEAGKVRALAIAGKTRSSMLPDVPTFTELGFAALEPMAGVHSILAPAGTPASVLSRLNAELTKILRTPEMVAFVKERGGEPAASVDVGEARRLFDEDHMRWQQAMQAIGGLPPLD